jgi:glycerol-3-phosphate dehydrogenase
VTDSVSARRTALVRRLTTDRFDVLVIGGGITGCGTARDLALRGVRVALVERDDWASGTSSRSSRLVHGGVRYLEHGHVGLVFESSRERRTLLRIAPHLVRPLAFTWPVYRGARVPRWKLEAGLALYDALALFRNVRNHRPLSARGVLAAEPALAREGLRGGARYYDAATDDARLTLANAIAAAEAGAVAANHLRVDALLYDGSGRAAGASCTDLLTGERLDVRAKVVVAAAGPWGDRLRRLSEPGARAGVLGSKGVHIAVPRERIGNRAALTLLAPSDGRVTFALPAGPHAIIGTTETADARDPDEVRATEADVAYLLDGANTFFPEARLTRADVVSAWAGVRPLVAGEPGADAGSASREHRIAADPRGVLHVSGGKLTTYRAMAADVADAAERALGRAPSRCTTAALPLPGGDGPGPAAERAAATVVAGAEVAARLVQAHGSRWRRVWAYAEREPALAARVVEQLPYTLAELAHAVEEEGALTLGDLLIRRTPVAFETRDAGRAAAFHVADVLAARLGWDAAAVRAALSTYEAEARRTFGVDA